MAKTRQTIEQRYAALIKAKAQFETERNARSDRDAARARALEQELEDLSVKMLLVTVHKAEALFDDSPVDCNDLPVDLHSYVSHAIEALEELSRQLTKFEGKGA